MYKRTMAMKRDVQHLDVCLQEHTDGWEASFSYDGGSPEAKMEACGYHRPKEIALKEFAKEVAEALIRGYRVTEDLDLSF